jgi:hypothetical protein
MSTPPFHEHIIEEADVGICANGWDNFLLYSDTSELEEYLEALRYLNASKCAEVIKEVLDLVAATKPARAIELADSHKEQLELLWLRYVEASGSENPQELAKQSFQQD